MTSTGIKTFAMLEFKNSIHLDLRKRVTLEWEKRYAKAKFVSFHNQVSSKIMDIENVWEQILYQNLRDIERNPSSDLAKVIIDKWSLYNYTSDLVQKSALTYLCRRMEHPTMDMAYTKAYITLFNKVKSMLKKAPKTDEKEYEWVGDIKRCSNLFLKLQENALIDQETQYNAFKSALNGGFLANIQPIKFTCSKNLQVYLFDELMRLNFMSMKDIKHNKLIESICGIENAHSIRYSYQINKDEKPKKGSDIIDNILNNL